MVSYKEVVVLQYFLVSMQVSAFSVTQTCCTVPQLENSCEQSIITVESKPKCVLCRQKHCLICKEPSKTVLCHKRTQPPPTCYKQLHTVCQQRLEPSIVCEQETQQSILCQQQPQLPILCQQQPQLSIVSRQVTQSPIICNQHPQLSSVYQQNLQPQITYQQDSQQQNGYQQQSQATTIYNPHPQSPIVYQEQLPIVTQKLSYPPAMRTQDPSPFINQQHYLQIVNSLPQQILQNSKF